MRPLKHGPSSFISHVFTRNNIYYFRANVPADLKRYFPTDEIKRSLKTPEPKAAKVLAVSLEYQLQQTFMMLRTGMLPDEVVNKVVQQVMPTSKKENVNQPKINTLSAIIEKYAVAKQEEWTEKTKMEVGSVVKLLVDIVGDVEVATITRPKVLELRATLQKLPANLYKKYPGKTIKQILAMVDVEPMSLKSVNKHVARLGAILRYCVDEGILASNPASGLKVSEKKRVDEERSTYSKTDIQAIVTSLPRDLDTPERYWIPMIGLYSGMRLNEICQLYVSDIVEYEGCWCFSINGEKDKRLKNTASERLIPIHPELVKCGLLEYVDKMKMSASPRLWMNLTWMDIHGYSNGFGKWYQRFNRSHVTKDPKKVFHSMRHTVADTLKQAGIPEVVISEILGHTHMNITSGRYGKRYQPKVLLEALAKLDYGEI